MYLEAITSPESKVMRHETRAVEVGVRELTEGRNIRESVLMEMCDVAGER